MRGKRGAGRLVRRPNGRWQAQFSRTEGGIRVRDTRIELRRYDADHYGAKGEGKHVPPPEWLAAEYARLGEKP